MATEVEISVHGEKMPLCRACKQVAHGKLPIEDLRRAVAEHPSAEDRVEICATFNARQYEIVMWGGFGLYAAAAKPEETIPLLLARARAGAEAIARKKTPFVTSDVLLALVRLGVILGPELDPLVEWHTTGIMRAHLAGPRELFATLPIAQREAIVLQLKADTPRGMGLRGSGYAWDFADLCPTPAVAQHLRAGLQVRAIPSPEVQEWVTRVLAIVERGSFG